MHLIHQMIKRYFIRSFWRIWLALILLSMLFQWIAQTRHLGEGLYHLGASLEYVCLTTPRNAYRILPITLFLSAYAAFNQLEQQKILLSLRILGITWARIITRVLLAMLPLILSIWILGTFLAPQMALWGKQHKAQAISGQNTLIHSNKTEENAWIHQGSHMIHIHFNPYDDQHLHDIQIWTMNSKHHRLEQFQSAQHATYKKNTHQWSTEETAPITIKNNPLKLVKTAPYAIFFSYNPYLIKLSKVDPDQQSIMDLIRIKQLEGKLPPYLTLHLLEQILAPIALFNLILLGILAIPSNQYIPQQSARLLLLFITFICVYLIQETLGLLSFLSAFPILFSALLPAIVYGLINAILIYHLARRH
jgi:lipopolysaccharide export system permease protein